MILCKPIARSFFKDLIPNLRLTVALIFGYIVIAHFTRTHLIRLFPHFLFSGKPVKQDVAGLGYRLVIELQCANSIVTTNDQGIGIVVFALLCFCGKWAFKPSVNKHRREHRFKYGFAVDVRHTSNGCCLKHVIAFFGMFFDFIRLKRILNARIGFNLVQVCKHCALHFGHSVDISLQLFIIDCAN